MAYKWLNAINGSKNLDLCTKNIFQRKVYTNKFGHFIDIRCSITQKLYTKLLKNTHKQTNELTNKQTHLEMCNLYPNYTLQGVQNRLYYIGVSLQINLITL